MIYSEYVLLCIAIPIAITLIFIKGSTRRFALFFLIGMGTCLVAAYIGGYVEHLSGHGEEWNSIYISPVVEEILKLMPLLFYLILMDPEDSDIWPAGVSLAAGFATFENCCFILTAGAESFSFVLVRGMAVGVMHVVSIMAVCLGLILVRRLVSFSLATIMGALSFSMTFHSLYNLLVSVPGAATVIGYVLPVISAVLLYFPYRRLDRAEKGEEIDEIHT